MFINFDDNDETAVVKQVTLDNYVQQVCVCVCVCVCVGVCVCVCNCELFAYYCICAIQMKNQVLDWTDHFRLTPQKHRSRHKHEDLEDEEDKHVVVHWEQVWGIGDTVGHRGYCSACCALLLLCFVVVGIYADTHTHTRVRCVASISCQGSLQRRAESTHHCASQNLPSL